MSKVIGIDLGTTNSVVAVMEGGEPVVIGDGAPEAEGGRGGSPRPESDRRGHHGCPPTSTTRSGRRPGDDLQAIRQATDALQTASHRMAEQLYNQQASGPGPQASGKDDVKEGEVVDA